MTDVATLGLAVDSTQVIKGSAALDELAASGKGADAAVGALEKSANKTGVAQKALTAALSGVSAQLIALSAGAGPVGVFLSALGPWGIAAAVGLGGLATAFSYVKEEAARMGSKAIELNAFRAATDLTIAQISALKQAGAQLGVTGDTVQTSFERLTAGLQDARRATGPLYDDVQKIDGGLAKQLESARTVAEGIDVLAKAYKSAGDASAKLDLSRSIFGRGGAPLGAVLGKVDEAGGLAKLSTQLKNVGDQTDDTTDRWARMQAKIEETERRAKNILASIFTEQGLQAALKAAEYAERYAKAIKEATENGSIGKAAVTGNSGFGSELDLTPTLNTPNDPKVLAAAAAEAGAAWDKLDEAMGTASVAAANRAAEALAKVTKSTKELQDAAAAAAKTQQDLIAFLGSGATIADRLKGRLDDINSAYKDGRTGAATAMEADRNKYLAENAARLDAVIQRESMRIGALGALATVSDAVLQKQLEINKANQQGAGITPRQTKAILDFTAAQALGTLAIGQQTDAELINIGALGKSTGAATAYRAEQELILAAIRKGVPLRADQIADIHKAADAYGRAAQKAAELRMQSDLKFEGSQFGRTDTEARVAQTLRQLYGDEFQSQQEGAIANQIRFNETLKSTKAFGEDALSGLMRDIRDAKSGTEALQNVLTKLENKLFDIASNKIMSALTGVGGDALSGLFKGVGGGIGNTASTGSNPGFSIGGAHEGAIVGSEATFARMFRTAPRHHKGTGMVGLDEVPIIAKRGEGVFTPEQMKRMAPVGSGGGGPITVNVVNAPAGSTADVKRTQQPGGGVNIEIALRRMIDDTTASLIANGNSKTHDVIKDRFGLSPRL